MLNYIIEQTDKYIITNSKDDRKFSGQFFTSKETAQFMANMFSIPDKETVKILDPGSGTGILSAALVERLQKYGPTLKKIELTCFEPNESVHNVLSSNLDFLKRNSRIELSTTIIAENYLLSQQYDYNRTLFSKNSLPKYDLVISNPPYFKLSKDAPEALSMKNVCHGTPNIYFLFMVMGLFNLENEGEMVFIIPRSWTSGAYFNSFRQYLFHEGRILAIHLFSSRNKVFDMETVLQETMIILVKKTKHQPQTITITSTPNAKCFDKLSSIDAPYSVVISGSDKYVFLVTSDEDINVLKTINTIGMPLPTIGLKMKTGLTIDFRNRKLLRNIPGENSLPLFYSHHIKNGSVVFPAGKENEYISNEVPSLIQLNRNYLFVKRFTSKEEKRRLQCAIYLARQFPQYNKISTQNKINFIDTIDNSEMSEELVFGLYTIFNSSLYDNYYRILNGSTQVNSTEMNSIPMPSKKHLLFLGAQLKSSSNYSTSFCDSILEQIIDD